MESSGVELASKETALEKHNLLGESQSDSRLDEPSAACDAPPSASALGECRSWCVPLFAYLSAAVLASAVGFALGYFAVDFLMAGPRSSVHFLVVGDWGRNGGLNQTAVANAMALKAEAFNPEFVISVGDNFYESGLTSVDDEQFDTSFTKVYHHESLQVPWYAILGNHDYGEWWDDTKTLKSCPTNSTTCYFSPLHQLSNELRKRDKRWFCERWYEKSLLDGQAELFFIDTNPFILDYHYQEWSNNTGGILQQSWQSQILELEARLAASKAKWKLVIGHHPVRNQHMPQNTAELMQHLEPVLDAQKVQAYFSGHEHNLQYMHVDSDITHYIVSGGGSLTDYASDYWDNGGGVFQHQGSGFVSCKLSLEDLKCSFHGIEGEILLDIEVKPDL